MVSRKWFSIALPILALAGLGFWLLGQRSSPAPEGAARLAALTALGPVGQAGGATTAVATVQSQTLTAAAPAIANLSNINPDFQEPPSMLDQWLAGEIDLEQENYFDAATVARLQEEALASGPTPGMQDVSGLAQESLGLGVSGWPAISFGNSGASLVPPDPVMAAGPANVFVAVNASLAVYDKSGAPLAGPLSAAALMGAGGAVPSCSAGLYDPGLAYDPVAERWLILFDQGAFASSGGFCLAVSQSKDPLGDYWIYFLGVNSSAAWLDYPQMAVGDTHLFIGGNAFDGIGQFVQSRLYGLKKADLYAGADVTVYVRGLAATYFTPQPLRLLTQDHFGAFGDRHYFLTTVMDGRNYPLISWDPLSNSLTNHGSIDLGQADYPIDAPQKDGQAVVANDWRPLDFKYGWGYGWTAMNVACNPGSGTVNCVRWAQIDLATADLGPAGTGTFAGGAGVHRFFPSLAVNTCGTMLVGYTESSPTTFPGVGAAMRYLGADPGQISTTMGLKSGEIVYVAFDDAPRRWGDYTAAVVDPDGTTFWYLGQYSKNTSTTAGRWGTWVASVPDSCPTSTTFLPVVISP